MRTALLAGATGLVGSQLLEALLNDGYYERITAISRDPLPFTDPRLHNIVADFKALPQFNNMLVADDLFCCLGTTMAQAKSKKAFRQVDFDYPVFFAKAGLENGAKQFLLISALGADQGSAVFYNRVKGETETAVLQTGFRTVHIFRPSLLLGARKKARIGERIGKNVMAVLGFLIPEKYKAIESERVAKAMIACAKKDTPGHFIHESAEMQGY